MDRQDTRGIFDRVARDYDRYDASPVAIRLASCIIDAVTSRLSAGSAIVDVGCGPGTLALQLAARGYKATGVDISSSMLSVALERASAGGFALETIEHDVELGPVPGDPYDGLVATLGPLNYTPDPRAMMRNLRASVRTGGRAWLGLARGAQLPGALRHPLRAVAPLLGRSWPLPGAVGGRPLTVYLWDPRHFLRNFGDGWALRDLQAIGLIRHHERLDALLGARRVIRHLGSVSLLELEAI